MQIRSSIWRERNVFKGITSPSTHTAKGSWIPTWNRANCRTCQSAACAQPLQMNLTFHNSQRFKHVNSTFCLHLAALPLRTLRSLRGRLFTFRRVRNFRVIVSNCRSHWNHFIWLGGCTDSVLQKAITVCLISIAYTLYDIQHGDPVGCTQLVIQVKPLTKLVKYKLKICSQWYCGSLQDPHLTV